MKQAEVIVVEEHSGSLVEWYERGLHGRTLVFLDAHLDLQFIGEERISRLIDAGSPDRFRQLEKPDHLLPDGDYVFGLENWLYAAHRLGIVERLIWVAPPHVDISYSEGVLRHVQQMDGVTLDEILSIEQSADGWYHGKLLGLDIVVCNLEHLPSVEPPAGSLIDIDTDYFIDIPGDKPWASPMWVYEQLVSACSEPALITIARSVSSGFMPMRYSFVADHLAALFRGDTEQAEHHGKLYRWSTAGGTPAEIDEELQTFPACATTHYLRAACSDDDASREEHAAQARSLAPPYASDPVRKLCGAMNRHQPVSSKLLNDVTALVESEDEAGERAIVALGLGLASVGKANDAYRYFTRLSAPHPALAHAIARLLKHPRDAAVKARLLELGRTEDVSATWSLVGLAELAMRERDVATAKELLEAARRRCPAWIAPLEWLAQLPLSPDDPSRAEFEQALKTHRDALRNAIRSR